MNFDNNDTIFKDAVQILMNEGFDGFPEAMRLLLNAAMAFERQNFLKAKPYERIPERTTSANGFKDKTVKTRVGQITLKLPQVRDSSFYPSSIEKGLRSERALSLAIAEMYIQGVSTRKVTEILKTLCDCEISSSQVSNETKKLDEMVQAWRERPLKSFSYIYLDARYEKVRVENSVVDCAVLIALGINLSGKREILGDLYLYPKLKLIGELF